MAWQLSVATRNAMLEAIATALGSNAILEIRSGAAPANCAAADTGTLLASMTMATPFAAAASGMMAKNGTWSDAAADANGTAGHFRLKTSGSTVIAQGTVTATGGGGDLQLATTTIATGQTVTVTSFTITRGNA